MKKLLLLIVSLVLVLGVLAGPGYGATLALLPAFDTYVVLNDDTDKSTSEIIYFAAADSYKGYFQFDLGAIPAGSTITNATLKIFCFVSSDPPPSFELYHVQNDAAVNASMTWGTQPAAGATPLDTQPVAYSETGAYFYWNLMATSQWQYASDLADSKLSLQLAMLASGTDMYAMFNTTEIENSFPGHRYDPWLTLEYTASNVPIPGSVWLLSSGVLALLALRRKSRHSG
jgi:hypothetical protein